MYLVGRYRPYEELVAEAARDQDLDPALAGQLVARWDELRPWPEAVAVLTDLAGSVPLGVVTNCSNELGRRAAERVGVPFDVVVTAERAGAHKPRPEPYHYALEELAVAPEAVLLVAGSPNDRGPATPAQATDRGGGMLGLRLGPERWSEDPERQALMQIGVTQGPDNLGTADLQDHGRSPHGSPHRLYRALILAHGRGVTWPPKLASTRENGHAVSLLIMVCFQSVGRRFRFLPGAQTWL